MESLKQFSVDVFNKAIELNFKNNDDFCVTVFSRNDRNSFQFGHIYNGSEELNFHNKIYSVSIRFFNQKRETLDAFLDWFEELEYSETQKTVYLEDIGDKEYYCYCSLKLLRSVEETIKNST